MRSFRPVEHDSKRQVRPQNARESYHHLYNDRAWRRASKGHLASNPLCVECKGIAEVTDHIVPHRGDVRLFWDAKNWQAMCKRCHDRKTASEQRGKA